MRLCRETPPPSDLGEAIEIGQDGGPVWLTVEPRKLNRPDSFFKAFAKACAVIWGETWHAGLERSVGLRKGTVKKWMRGQIIPPPQIVGWVAYIASREDARAIGYHLQAFEISDEPGTIAEAERAHQAISPDAPLR